MTVLEIPAFGYHADLIDDERPSLSASVIHQLVSKSAAHAKAAHPKLNPQLERQEEKHFDIGTAAHALLLEGEAAVDVLEFDNYKTKAAQEARDLSRAHGRIPLLDRDWADVQAMAAAMRSQLDRFDPPLFTRGQHEQTLVWEEREVLCRARLDFLHDDRRTVDDFKTATNPEPGKWSRGSFFDHGCDIQAALYLRGVRAVFNTDATFRFAVVEKQPPYELTVFSPAPDTLALANRKIDWALDVWARCLETGEWPGYPKRVCWVNLEPWHEVRWLDREARDEL